MKKILIYVIFITVGIGLGAGGYYMLTGNSSEKKGNAGNKEIQASQEKTNKKILYWRAPMNPKEIYNHPGKSNMGMDLVPVYADNSGMSGVVSIDPVIQQDMNVKTVVVKTGKLYPGIFTNGILQPDEQREYIATTKIGGWIDKLYINYTGQKVQKGDKLIRIYSPELVAAQEEYLTALAYDNAMKNTGIVSELTNNAIRKLELLDVSDQEIQRLKKTRKVRKYVIIYAPFAGTVLFKGVDEGAKINRGTPLLKIADLSSLWILADIYEYELSKIKTGLPAKISFDYLPGKEYHGSISFVYPTLDPRTRTIKVRIVVPNKNHELKPGMFANVDIKGESAGNYVLVPEQAVLRSGKQNTVIIALGEGKFKPAEVVLGAYSNGFYQVLEGLPANTRIVTSAQFLIDSESNLRASLSLFTSQKNNNDTTEKKMDMKTEKQQTSQKKEETSAIIRKGVIDVKAIDKNGDGILFQDIMDWNVISDKPGKCPLCGMELRKMSIEQVEKNLKEHDFKVKK